MPTSFSQLMENVRACTLCEAHLPNPPRPVLSADTSSRIVIIGQAPGIKAHNSFTPWNDVSGDRLRQWLGIDRDTFYDVTYFSLIPMGFCFPGYLRGADAPPRKECAPTWHQQLLSAIAPELILFVGRYSQHFYLPEFKTLTDAVEAQRVSLAGRKTMVLPHPRTSQPYDKTWL